MISFNALGQWGRLGNQLFSYAALYNTARYNGYEFGIPYRNETPTYYVNDPKGSFKYGLEIHNCFNITAKDSSSFKPTNKYSQIDFNYNPDLLKIEDNTDIVGYFQSELYFKEYKDDLLKEFTFKKEIQECANIIIKHNRVKYHSILVSLHVRRGDYTLLPDHHPLCTIEYYKSSIEYIQSQIGEYFTILLFSDDIDFCREQFKDYDNIVFMSNNTFVDLCLMSMCDHHIIANSSYSWWGSYLNQNDHITIAPKLWFGTKHNNLNTRDLLPEKWIKL